MRIKEKIERAGYFWLPSASEKRVPGTLTITDGGNIELEIVGLFDSNIEALNGFSKGKNEIQRIIGEIEKDGLVTLDNCFYRNQNISFGGVSKSIICVNKAFVGAAYDENEDIRFNSVKFSVEGIDEWIGLTGISVERSKDMRTATIRFEPPEEVSLSLNNGMQLLITFSWTHPGFPNITEAKITQKAYFKLVSEHERSLKDFIDAVYKITTFLCFAIDKTVSIDNMMATLESYRRDIGGGKTQPIPISIYCPSKPYVQNKPKIEWHEMLFMYGQIHEDAERLINNWFGAYEKINVALSLYFSTKTETHKYLEGKFLALAQGLETYHRRTTDEKVMEDDVFEVLTNEIIAKCPQERQEWLSGKLRYANEITLAKRLKGIIDPFKENLGDKKAQEKLTRDIVDTRNFLTHYDKSLESKAASGIDLWYLCLKMEAIFQLHLLQVLGFTHTQINSILENNYAFKRKFLEGNN